MNRFPYIHQIRRLAGILCLLGAVAFSSAAAESVSHNVPPEAAMLGVNLAVGEFGKLPGVFNKDYTYPAAKHYAAFQARGLGVVRLPFKWERLQPELMKPLDATELTRLDASVQAARESGVKLLLDVHNYARYRGKIIGTPEVPNAAFADFWKQLAAHYHDEPAVFAYGIMNEPHGTGGLWPAAAQTAVDAIRTVDRKHTISVCGEGWSGAHSWKKFNANLRLTDPASNLIYEAHQYFDHDNSGTYKRGYDASKAHPGVGVARLQPFLDWLKERDARGFIGEFGVPGDDPRWLEVLDNFIAAMKRNGLGGTYWAAGPWWGNYPLSVEPVNGQDRPQMEVLALYAGDRIRPAGTKASYDGAFNRLKNLVRPPGADGNATPPAKEKVVHDFRVRRESYHYNNEGSEFASGAVNDGERLARRIAFKHHGNPAWIGMGLFFGGLKCDGYAGFNVDARAARPCVVEVKAHAVGGGKFSGKFQISGDWRRLDIPFADLRNDQGAFDGGRPLEKIEFQPGPDQRGNELFLGEFRLAAP